MKLTITYKSHGSYDIVAHPDLPLAELANGLVQVYSSMICRGGYRFTTMKHSHPTDIYLSVSAMTQPAPMIEFASFTPLSHLLHEKLMPWTFPPQEVWGIDDDAVVYAILGHQRTGKGLHGLFGKPGRGGRFILNQKDLRTVISVAEHAYYIADTTMAFLWRGASTHRVQMSQMLLQHDFDVGLKREEAEALFVGNDPNYPIADKVSMIR